MEADKTCLEFSDWAAAKSACIAMLLAFLPHFPHAVPDSVMRDLRREFHKMEGGEAWTTASPPPPPRRASPEPALPPSPSPMRLGVPDLGISFYSTEGSPLDSCVWMGSDRDLSKVSEEGRYTMVSCDNFMICTCVRVLKTGVSQCLLPLCCTSWRSVCCKCAFFSPSYFPRGELLHVGGTRLRASQSGSFFSDARFFLLFRIAYQRSPFDLRSSTP